MRMPVCAALAALFVMPAAAQDGPPRGAMPPAVISQINLGGAGLLPLFYSDNQFGLTQARNGESRARIGDAASSVGPVGSYQNSSKAITVPVTLRYGLPDGTAFLTLKGVYNYKDEDPNRTTANSNLKFLSLGLQYFFSPNGMVGASVGKNTFESRAPAVNVDRDSIDVRFDYLQKFNANWGFAGRAILSLGDTTLTVKRPGIITKQGDNYLYTQAELAGTFTNKDWSLLPKGLAFRPVAGFSLQTGDLADARNSFGAPVAGASDNIGSLWAKATLARQDGPGQLIPFGTLGIEHVYRDSNNAFISENTYGVLGGGLSYQTKGGANFTLTYDGRYGLNGNRSYNSVVAATVLTF